MAGMGSANTLSANGKNIQIRTMERVIMISHYRYWILPIVGPSHQPIEYNKPTAICLPADPDNDDFGIELTGGCHSYLVSLTKFQNSNFSFCKVGTC